LVAIGVDDCTCPVTIPVFTSVEMTLKADLEPAEWLRLDIGGVEDLDS
jgi:hypothetical protein